MFALTVLLYYFSALCIFIPIFTSSFRIGESKEEERSKPPYPWELMQKVFVFGIALLTAAVVLTILK